MPESDAARALLLLLNVAPLGVYFLTLGLLNSHSRPVRVSARGDFIALTCVVIPLLFWPVPALVTSRLWWVLAGGVLVCAGVFWRLVPGRGAGWVVYNISEGRWRTAVERAAALEGVKGRWVGNGWQAENGRTVLRYSGLGLLRNICVEVEAGGTGLARRLDELFERFEQLPSASGAVLVALGTGLLLGPLWTIGRHAEAVASAVTQLVGR